MAKIATAHTQYYDDSFTLRTLAPGDKLPKGHEAFVKNEKLFAEAPTAPTTTTPSTKSLADLSKPELVALAKERGIAHSGTAPAIRERLAAADVQAAEEAKAATAAAAAAASADAGDRDLSEMDREALEALAGELGIVEFDENTSDAELVALIENARG
jgi:pyruvate/2-oxoglutarate dehydrogenase complex dihydrolipoamide acyltransferase (E2) component